MRILTIKFPTSNKTYEYLERNPDKVRINYCEKLKIPEYCLDNMTTYKMLTVVNVRDVDVIPSHVTSFIEPIDKDNVIKIGKISEIHYNQINLLINKDKNTYIENKLLPIQTKEDIDEIFRENRTRQQIVQDRIINRTIYIGLQNIEARTKYYISALNLNQGGKYGK